MHVRRDTVTAKWQSGDPLTKPTKQGALNCGAFDFLAMGSSTKVREAAQAALTKYGCGSCGPRGFWSIDVHEQLEARVASFSNTKQAIAFSDAASCTSTVAASRKGDLLVVDDGIGAWTAACYLEQECGLQAQRRPRFEESWKALGGR